MPKQNIKKTEEKQLREYKEILREFYQLRLVGRIVFNAMNAKDNKSAHKNLNKAIKYFTKEERFEVRVARAFERMLRSIENDEIFLAKKFPSEVHAIKVIIEKARVYDTHFKKIASRGGQIEKMLDSAKEDLTKLKDIFALIKNELTQLTSFEELIKELMQKYKILASEYEIINAKPIPPVTYFDSGMSVISVGKGKIIACAPSYLLGKHGSVEGEKVASKFFNLDSPAKLTGLLLKNIKPNMLKGDRIEIKEVNTGMVVGVDSLIKVNDSQKWGILKQEEVRGSIMNVVNTNNQIPFTSLLNIILVKFNPQFGSGVDKDFEIRYGKSFDEFEVYAVLTMFPGKYAPAANDTGFWEKHALLKSA